MIAAFVIAAMFTVFGYTARGLHDNRKRDRLVTYMSQQPLSDEAVKTLIDVIPDRGWTGYDAVLRMLRTTNTRLTHPQAARVVYYMDGFDKSVDWRGDDCTDTFKRLVHWDALVAEHVSLADERAVDKKLAS